MSCYDHAHAEETDPIMMTGAHRVTYRGDEVLDCDGCGRVFRIGDTMWVLDASGTPSGHVLLCQSCMQLWAADDE